MNKMVLFLLLAFSSANAQVGKVTRLMTKIFPMCPERKA